jgi:hypothetical protein
MYLLNDQYKIRISIPNSFQNNAVFRFKHHVTADSEMEGCGIQNLIYFAVLTQHVK